MQPEVVFVELGTLGHGLQAIEKVELRITPSSREYEITSLVCFAFPRLETPLTVQHIKNLASGIFTHAANLDLIESNPWSFCKVLGKALPDGVTEAYTLEEIENIISALVDHVDSQLIMALTFFMGLRKGEIQGLQWSDIDVDYIHVRRNITRGHITTPKRNQEVSALHPHHSTG